MALFDKILIANRGEIACRVMRTARRLGIRTVAVYSQADRAAWHVALADEAVEIGPAPAAQSYLRGDRIIAAARRCGAQAIHPGYGFLSENPDFVQAVHDAGLVFVGPGADAVRAMGLKDAAKRLMQAAGVPVVPGYHGERQEADFLFGQAEAIGFPVLVKASAGGGGKGMRRVDDVRDFADALESCRREARSTFGDERVLIEKYVVAPRHIEVQVFGDAHGNVVHLFERDCSVQRRHQKVIEEAPAPGMSDAVRAAMTSAAVRAARAIGYRSAGTIEFIADGSGPLRPDGFWFMEMNTRLQVEHPVTEAITGFDLVEWQLRVAAGEPLPVRQEDIRIHGHAVEARLYAEDPSSGFLPQAGSVEVLHFPAAGEGLRIDAGVRGGDLIPPYYDPMIAKLIAHGADRTAALDRLGEALAQTHFVGPPVNRDFLLALSRDEVLRAGRMTTGLIDERLVELLRPIPVPETALAFGMLLAYDIDPNRTHAGFRLWDVARHMLRLDHAGRSSVRQLSLPGDGRIVFSGAQGEITLSRIALESAAIRARVGERQVGAAFVRLAPGAAGARVSVLFDGHAFVFARPDALLGDGAGHHPSDEVLAPMTGVVSLVCVQPGDAVRTGERLLVMEAMKMEYALQAPHEGVVADVLCQAGSAVDGGAVLVRFAPAPDGEER